MVPECLHPNQVAIAMTGGESYTECEDCGHRMQQTAPPPTMTLNRTGDQFLRSLLHDKQQVFTALYRGGEIRDDRGNTVFRYGGRLPEDPGERLTVVHQAIAALFCVGCENRLKGGEKTMCVACRRMVGTRLQQDKRRLS